MVLDGGALTGQNRGLDIQQSSHIWLSRTFLRDQSLCPVDAGAERERIGHQMGHDSCTVVKRLKVTSIIATVHTEMLDKEGTMQGRSCPNSIALINKSQLPSFYPIISSSLSQRFVLHPFVCQKHTIL